MNRRDAILNRRLSAGAGGARRRRRPVRRARAGAGRHPADPDRADTARRLRAGFRLRPAQRGDAESLAADAVAADGADHRAGDPAIRIDRGAGRLAAVQASDRLRLGNRHKSIPALRQRLIAGGDLAASAGTSRGVRFLCRGGGARFQARHGITIDGIVREQTFNALNVPADVRLNQLKTNLVAAAQLLRQSRRRAL